MARSSSRGPGPATRVAMVLATLLLGCAQIEAPSGGPEDRETPRILGTYPDSGAVEVPLGDSLVLLFSETMNRRTVEEGFFLSPPVEYRERRWRKQLWILRLQQPLRAGQTYVGLLGTTARDRHQNSLRIPWSFAFATGESLDTGRVNGNVIGARYPPKGVYVYVWPWESGYPDTLREGYPPDALRLGQADDRGAYDLGYLPRGRDLLICALYDREGDHRYRPGVDLWACSEGPVRIDDTTRVLTGLDLYLASPDEPGTVEGSVIDSLCLRSKARQVLLRVRARRDSLYEWMDAGTGSAADGEKPRPERALSGEDSLRIGRELLGLDSLRTTAAAESAFCALPLLVRLTEGDTTLIREAKGPAEYKWSDVPPGVYHLSAFRDVNGNGREDPGEPSGVYPHAIEVRPLRVLDRLDLLLTAPASGGAP